MSAIGKNVVMRLLALLLTPLWFVALYLLVYGQTPAANLQWLALPLFLVVHVGGALVVYLLHRSWALSVVAFLFPPVALPILAFKDLGHALAIQRERQEAARVGAKGDVGRLVQALGDGRSKVREQARQRLRQMGPAAIAPLLGALPRVDAGLRQVVVQALDELGWQPTPDQAGALYWATKGQWSRCVEIGAPAVEALLLTLQTANWSQRPAIIQALGQIGDPRAVQPLTAALLDRGAAVPQAAAQALEQIGVPAETIQSVVAGEKKKESQRSALWGTALLAGVVLLIVG